MLALLALPSCCCLKSQEKEEDCGVGEESCCASVEESLPTPIEPLIPSNDFPDPCDCEMSVAQVLTLPENEFLKVETSENDYSTDWVEINEISNVHNSEVDISPSTALSLAYNPPGRRYFQDYCVIRI